MKPIDWGRAKYLADSLTVADAVHIGVDKAEAMKYREVMTSYTVINETITVFEPTQEDLYALRCMLACELHLGGREQVLYRLLNRHEDLHKRKRTKVFYDDLPAMAVFAERNNHSKSSGHKGGRTAVQGGALQQAITGAMHGRR